MDLRKYEQLKFELAEIVRCGRLIQKETAEDAPSAERSRSDDPWRELLTRIAEDRFTVVVAGRFNRGKSSLMNALLGLERLPVGVVPLTSVITCVTYGTTERALVEYQGSRLRSEARLDELPDYVTEKGNPGNIKQLRSVEIQLPAEILRRGFWLVDTPGLGSAIFENTRTTESFISEIDVLVLVTSYESPLTEEEVRFLEKAAASDTGRAVFIVVNKHDTLPPAERAEVLEYIAKTARRILGERFTKPFSVSARDGMAAKKVNDPEALRASGIFDFESELIRFLAAERARLFLAATCHRVLVQLETLPDDEAEPLNTKVRELLQRINGHPRADSAAVADEPRRNVAARGASCEICQAIEQNVWRFLSKYQYELSSRPETQEEHARRGGFCPQHTWHYAQVASPRGICTAYPRLLDRLAEALSALAIGGEPSALRESLARTCPACKVRAETEARALHAYALREPKRAQANAAGSSRICLPHLERLLEQLDDVSLSRSALLGQALVLERTAEDLQRYAIKHDGLRRHLASEEETSAPTLALQLLVGYTNVNASIVVDGRPR